MKKRAGIFLVALIGSLFALSFAACVRLPHKAASKASQFATRPLKDESALLDINTASPEELERLPGIGPALAARIISYREQYGRFRRAEHLIMVRGIGERRFRRLRPFITAL